MKVEIRLVDTHGRCYPVFGPTAWFALMNASIAPPVQPSSPSYDSQPVVAPLSVRIVRADDDRQVVPLPGGATTIGGGPRCSLRVEGHGIRPLHCVITNGPNGATVRRWGADTYLNGAPFTESALEVGDCLTVAEVELLVQASEDSDSGFPGPEAITSEETVGRLTCSLAANTPLLDSAIGSEPASEETSTERIRTTADRSLVKRQVANLRTRGLVTALRNERDRAVSDAARITATEQEKQNVQNDLEVAQSKLAAAEGEKEGLEAEIRSLSDRLTDSEDAVFDLRSKVVIADSRVFELEQQAARLQADLEVAQAGLEASLGELLQRDQSPGESSVVSASPAECRLSEDTEPVAEEQASETIDDLVESDTAGERIDSTDAETALLEAAAEEELEEGATEHDQWAIEPAAEEAQPADSETPIVHAADADEAAAVEEDWAPSASVADDLWGEVETCKASSPEPTEDPTLAADQVVPSKACHPAVDGGDLWDIESTPPATQARVAKTPDAFPSEQPEATDLAEGEASQDEREAADRWLDSFKVAAEEAHKESPSEVIESEATDTDAMAPEAIQGDELVSTDTVPIPPRDLLSSESLREEASSQALEPQSLEAETPETETLESQSLESQSPETESTLDAELPAEELASTEVALEESPLEATSEEWPAAEAGIPEEASFLEKLKSTAQAIEEAAEATAEVVNDPPADEPSSLAADSDDSSFPKQEFHEAEVVESELLATVALENANEESAARASESENLACLTEEPAIDAQEQACNYEDTLPVGDDLIAKEQPATGAPQSFYEKYADLLPEDDAADEPLPVVVPPTPVEPEPAAAGEDSIEDYMASLMQRIRGDSEATKPVSLPQPVDPVEPEPETAMPETMAEVPAAEPAGPITDLESLRSAPAPERGRDMSALRELANDSARTAIGVAHTKEHKEKALVNLTISGMAMTCGGYLSATAPSLLSIQFLGGLAGLCWAGFWASATLWPLLGPEQKELVMPSKLFAKSDATDADIATTSAAEAK